MDENLSKFELTDAERRRSMRCAMVSAISAIIGVGCIGGNVLNLLAIKLEADDFFLGVLNFAAIAPFAASLLTMSSIERVGKKRVLIFWLLMTSVFIIPFLMIPYFINVLGWSKLTCLVILIFAVFFRAAITALGITGWFPLLQDIVPREQTGIFFGKLRTSWQIASLICLLLLAWFLGREPAWWKFEVIFIIALIAIIVRGLAVIPMVDKKKFAASSGISTASKLREVCKSESFRKVAVYMVSYGVLVGASVPFIVKMIKGLGYSDGFVLAATAMMSLGAILTLRFWGKLADKFGNRAIFSISHMGMLVVTVMWIIVDKSQFGAVLIFMLFLFTSVFNSGNGIAQTRYLFHNIPSDKQYYLIIINTIAVFSLAVGPVIGGIFLKLTENYTFSSGALEMNNYHIFFVLNAALFAIPHNLRKRLRVEKEVSTNEVIAIVTRPLRSMIGPFVRIGKSRSGQNSDTEI